MRFLKNKQKFSVFLKAALNACKCKSCLCGFLFPCFFHQWFLLNVSFLISFTWEIVQQENSLSLPHTHCFQWFPIYIHTSESLRVLLKCILLSSTPRGSGCEPTTCIYNRFPGGAAGQGTSLGELLLNPSQFSPLTCSLVAGR